MRCRGPKGCLSASVAGTPVAAHPDGTFELTAEQLEALGPHGFTLATDTSQADEMFGTWDADPYLWSGDQVREFQKWFDELPGDAELNSKHPGVTRAWALCDSEWERGAERERIRQKADESEAAEAAKLAGGDAGQTSPAPSADTTQDPAPVSVAGAGSASDSSQPDTSSSQPGEAGAGDASATASRPPGAEAGSTASPAPSTEPAAGDGAQPAQADSAPAQADGAAPAEGAADPAPVEEAPAEELPAEGDATAPKVKKKKGT